MAIWTARIVDICLHHLSKRKGTMEKNGFVLGTKRRYERRRNQLKDKKTNKKDKKTEMKQDCSYQGEALNVPTAF